MYPKTGGQFQTRGFNNYVPQNVLAVDGCPHVARGGVRGFEN